MSSNRDPKRSDQGTRGSDPANKKTTREADWAKPESDVGIWEDDMDLDLASREPRDRPSALSNRSRSLRPLSVPTASEELSKTRAALGEMRIRASDYKSVKRFDENLESDEDDIDWKKVLQPFKRKPVEQTRAKHPRSLALSPGTMDKFRDTSKLETPRIDVTRPSARSGKDRVTANLDPRRAEIYHETKSRSGVDHARVMSVRSHLTYGGEPDHTSAFDVPAGVELRRIGLEMDAGDGWARGRPDMEKPATSSGKAHSAKSQWPTDDDSLDSRFGGYLPLPAVDYSYGVEERKWPPSWYCSKCNKSLRENETNPFRAPGRTCNYCGTNVGG